MVDIGCNGRMSDGGVFNSSAFKLALETNALHLPEPKVVPGIEYRVPYMVLADDAFPLSKSLMKPYPFRNLDVGERIFNYRLSRARRTVENAFGILANRFRVFLTPIAVTPDKVEKIVLGACTLHNYLRASQAHNMSGEVDVEDDDHNVIPGSWRDQQTLTGLPSTHARNASQGAKALRDSLKTYFLSEAGQVSWQMNMV